MKTAALYARFSTDKQDARSIDDQIRRCRAFAEARALAVVAVHQDAALSGASTARPGLQAVLREAKRRAFDAVIVDDLSRLSRDLGHTWNIIFSDLASVGVRVIDATTGMASDAAGARLTFGALALVNDTFLQLVKTETHRGLEGRALGGFWTGGSCYGYRTVPEPTPQDPAHPRAVPVIEADEAEVVRGIFARYAKGDTLGSILAWLSGQTAPADGATKKKAPGWSKSLLFSMLRNERYAGQFVWNRRKWTKDPTTGKRRYVERPEAEWVRVERPELAIVDRETWAQVQARHARTAQDHGERKRSTSPHMLSGLLRCGVCGGALSIVSQRKKGGVVYSQFGCSVRHSRGPGACANATTTSELGLNAAVLSALRTHLASPDIERWVAEVLAERAAESHAPDLAAEVRAAEVRAEKVADALARIGFSDTLARRLQNEEAKLRELRAQLTRAAPAPKRPAVSVRQVLAALEGLDDLAKRHPAQARAGLQSVVESVTLTPEAESGRVRATLQLKSETATLVGGRLGAESTGCGGRI
ncbi:recombinase family protein [Anaeromyxobacter dehalogenans]|uniref:Recombinase n=1 Tax=Anaeromyxobacter dehalogenans (strain 2CP-C) TaxID=290397 RepID=Q2IKC7_ANADE|nr:recombinase family protein [Anaeromyxobacter dehalogenans]ABC82106.1 Recombinase [Anaeromyxobacter dehalogenans 2CP-C]